MDIQFRTQGLSPWPDSNGFPGNDANYLPYNLTYHKHQSVCKADAGATVAARTVSEGWASTYFYLARLASCTECETRSCRVTARITQSTLTKVLNLRVTSEQVEGLMARQHVPEFERDGDV